MDLIAPEKISLVFSTKYRKNSINIHSEFSHFNVPGERAALQNGCHTSQEKNKGLLKLNIAKP